MNPSKARSGCRSRIGQIRICPKHQVNAGFTLIEVLIVMTLLSVMVVLLFATMRISADSWEKGENKIADVNGIAVVYSFFQRHLVTAKPLWNDFSSVDERFLGFQGSPQSLQFVSHFPASAGRQGLQSFFLKLNDVDKSILEIEIKPFYPLLEGESSPQEKITLVDHVKTFSLAYLGQNPNSGEVIWQDQWQNMETQPQLVKISIALDSGIYWPDMIIPLRITGEPESFDNAQAVNQESDGGIDPNAEDNGVE